MTFTPKSFQQIITGMAAKVSAETPINDFTPGSVIRTLIEMAAQEDFSQYVQMIEVTRAYNLETTEGEDLVSRAAEFGLNKLSAKSHSGYVSITDSRFSKIASAIYSGASGPSSGDTTIKVVDASSFPSSGNVYVGRGTDNIEGPIPYSALPVNVGTHWEITLDLSLANDHGTDETVILSQFGTRFIGAGTEVKIPESDFDTARLFSLNQNVELLDGEVTVNNVLVTAVDPGDYSVPSNSIRQFVNNPFTGAEVSNPSPFVNGRDEETDEELRDRIRDTRQSLSRGTALSIKNAILGLVDGSTNSRVVSASVVPPTTLQDGPTKVYIDNGRGLEPTISTYGLETLIGASLGGEKFFQLSQFPLVKSNLITQNTGPFNLVGGENLILNIGVGQETFEFAAADFSTPGSATALEISQAINSRATTFESRTLTTVFGVAAIIFPTADQNEYMSVSNSSTANAALNFPTLSVDTLKLYKNDTLLTKDGVTATLESNEGTFDFSTREQDSVDEVVITSGSRVITRTPSSEGFTEIVKPGDYVKSDLDADAWYTKVQTVVDDDKLILASPYPSGTTSGPTIRLTVWSSPQLEIAVNGDESDTEIVSFGPQDFVDEAFATPAEAYARLSTELSASTPSLITNGTKIQITSNVINSSKSKLRSLGGYAGVALGLNAINAALTGTASFQGGSKLVSGTGTLFTTELTEGQWVKATGADNGAWSKVETIEDDVTLYLSTQYNGPTDNTTLASILKSSEAVGAGSDYTLNRSNGKIELTNALKPLDSLTAGSENTRAFVKSVSGPFDFSGLPVSTLIVKIDTPTAITAIVDDISGSLSDEITDPNYIGYDPNEFLGKILESTSGTNIGQTDVISAFDSATGKFTLLSGFVDPLLSGSTYKLIQKIEIYNNEFVDPTNATPAEIASQINAQLVGGLASVDITNRLKIQTNNFDGGSIQIVSGDANTILGFDITSKENSEPNVAFVQSFNNVPQSVPGFSGFTNGPFQTLIVVLDNNVAQKSYAIPSSTSAVVTSGSSGVQFISAAMQAAYTEDKRFEGYWVYWEAGSTNEGILQTVDTFNASTGEFTLTTIYPSGASPGTPLVGEKAYLVPRTVKNVVNHLTDISVTALSTSAKITETGFLGDSIQLSSKIPGSAGKVLISGGTLNKIGITILSVPNSDEIEVNSVSGLSKSLPVRIVSTAFPDGELVYINDIIGSSAPYLVKLSNMDGTPASISAVGGDVIRDANGLNFQTTQVEGTDGYRYYRGLIQQAQLTIDGLDSDQLRYPGVAAAGTQFEVLSPKQVGVSIQLNVTPINGVGISSIANDVRSEVLAYVRGLGVSEDIILSEIVAAAQSVTGVFDVEVLNLTENVIINENEKATLEPSDITIG